MTEAQKQKLLQQYIEGSIDTKNRHMLEREALDDPFLFDALEGYSSGVIQKSLEQKAPKKERPQIFTYLSMAASFLLIAGVAYLFNVSTTSTANADLIAINEEVESLNSTEDQSITLNEKETIHLRSNEPSVVEATINNSGADEKTPNAKSVGSRNGQVTVSNDDVQVQQNTRVHTKARPVVEAIAIKNSPEEQKTNETYADADIVEFDDATHDDSIENEAAGLAQAQVKPEQETDKTTNDVTIAEVIEEEGVSLVQLDKVEARSDNDRNSREKGELTEDVVSIEMAKSKAQEGSRIESGTVARPGASFVDSSTRNAIETDSIIIDEGSKTGSNFRKSFPRGGMDKFQEYLDDNPLDKNCSQGVITFKFLILPDGTLDEVEIIDDEALNSLLPKTYADCKREAKELLIDYGVWETVPANRRVRRTWKYTPSIK